MKKPEFIKVHEQDRTYVFPDGECIPIRGVTEINVSKSGTHRLNDSNGAKWVIRNSWLAIRFHAKDWTF